MRQCEELREGHRTVWLQELRKLCAFKREVAEAYSGCQVSPRDVETIVGGGGEEKGDKEEEKEGEEKMKKRREK